MKVTCLIVFGCVVCCLGCNDADDGGKLPQQKPVQSEQPVPGGDQKILKLTGSLEFKTDTGKQLVILTVTNSTDNVMWIPSSHGESFGCEAVNFKIGGLPGTHYDYGRCVFPDQYTKLKPKESHQYVHQLPKDAKGKIEMSIWAPWRTGDGKRIDEMTKGKALKSDEVLFEEVVGSATVD